MQVDVAESPNVLTAVDACDTVVIGTRTRHVRKVNSDTVKALLSIVDQAIFSGTSFVTAVIVGRATSPDVLGMYYLTMTIVYVAIGIQECTISNPFAILAPRRDGRELAEFTATTWVRYLTWNALCLVGLAGAFTWVSLHNDAHLSMGLSALLFALPLLLLRESIRRFAFARLHLATAVIVDATSSAVQLVGLFAMWYWEGLSLLGIFAVMAAGCGIASISWILRNWKKPALVRDRFASDWRETWAIARWSLASFMLTNMIPFIMPWIVDYAAGAAAAGLFGASATLVGVTNVLVLGGSNFLMPRAAEAFASRGAHGLSRVLIVMALLFILVIGSFGIVLLVTGDRIPVFVYGADFRNTGPLVATLAANVLAGSLGMIAAQGLLVIGRQRNNFVIDIGMFSITMITAVLLVPRYGALGAAIASLLGVTAGTSLRAIRLNLVLHGMRRLPQAA